MIVGATAGRTEPTRGATTDQARQKAEVKDREPTEALRVDLNAATT
ncbi:MAG: hypothetical protein P8K07_03565 [Candidatus Binatia bacterium]|nr:hypothetical protein [Candidatus Binatia bacterium]